MKMDVDLNNTDDDEIRFQERLQRTALIIKLKKTDKPNQNKMTDLISFVEDSNAFTEHET